MVNDACLIDLSVTDRQRCQQVQLKICKLFPETNSESCAFKRSCSIDKRLPFWVVAVAESQPLRTLAVLERLDLSLECIWCSTSSQ